MALIWHQSPLARLQRIYESCRPQLVAAARADAPGDETLHALPDPAPTPAETAEGRDAAASLRRALDTLDEPDRSILLLQYYEECSGKQIAALLGLSETNVRQRAARARQKLKQILETEGF